MGPWSDVGSRISVAGVTLKSNKLSSLHALLEIVQNLAKQTETNGSRMWPRETGDRCMALGPFREANKIPNFQSSLLRHSQISHPGEGGVVDGDITRAIQL